MKVFFLVCLTLFSSNLLAAGSCQLPEGTGVGSPVVKINPAIGKGVKDGDCVLLSFKLKEQKGSNGRALIPSSPKVEFSTNKRLSKAAKKAVKKWLYFAGAHHAGEVLYYSYVHSAE